MPPPPMSKPPAVASSKPSLPSPSTTSATPPKPLLKSPARQVKTFSVKPLSNEGQGQKITVYGPSGKGKTTLAALLPNAVWFPLDDGARMIRNGKTNEPLIAISGVDTFADLRDALHQDELFPKGSTVVIDTITKVQALIEAHLIANVKNEKGAAVESIEDYGWGKGYVLLTEHARLLLTDLDRLVARGVNVVLLAQQGQSTIANLEGTDYLQDGPKLHVDKKGVGIRAEVCEWCDHVIRLGSPELHVVKASKEATKGKAQGSTDRMLFTEAAVHYVAKSRPVNGTKLPPVISFENEQDDALWQFIFPAS